MFVLIFIFTYLVCAVHSGLVEYTWTVRPRRAFPPLSPDCFVDRDLLLVNDMNPGPVIRANVGDVVSVTIINTSPDKSLTIHYHGLKMYDQPYADGTPAHSQCNIPTMQTQVNVFNITERDVGVHYWHGHTSLDRMDGLQGAIIITDPNDPMEQNLQTQYDEEVIIFLQDWYHRGGTSNRNGLDNVPFIWVGDAQAFLINGKGLYQACVGVNTTEVPSCAANCTMSDYTTAIDVDPGKSYLLRVINAAALYAVNFAIANHSMTVVQTEGTFVEPIVVNSLDIGVAERYSVLLHADQADSQSYWMTTAIRFRPASLTGYAYLRYSGAAEPSETGPYPNHPAFNDSSTWFDFTSQLKTINASNYPEYEALTSSLDRSLIVVGNQAINNETGNLRWVSNNYSMTTSSVPTILSAYQAVTADGALTWPETEVEAFMELPDTPSSPWNYTANMQDVNAGTNLAFVGEVVARFVKGDVVELVLQNAVALNGVAEYHGWHLHGHSLWVVGQGFGIFDNATDPATFNLQNPVKRDTVAVLPYGWTAVRFVADNPGAWPFHCVIASHLVLGMGFEVVISPDLLPPPPPAVTSCLQNSLSVGDAAVCVNVPSQSAKLPTTSAGRIHHFGHAPALFVTFIVLFSMTLL